MHDLFQWLIHVEEHLGSIIRQQGGWTYLLLGSIVFLETGVVVLPFLPGDSLLFAVGTFAGKGLLDPWLCFSLLAIAAVIGDCVGYGLGCIFRDTLAQGKRVRLISPKHLRTTQQFYEKHGAKTIMMARFVPIVRAFAPFCAGLARMPFEKMLKYSLVGSVIWVGSLVWAGYFLGQIPIVKAVFPWLAGAVIVMTCVAVVREVVMQIRNKDDDDDVGGAVNPPPLNGPMATVPAVAGDASGIASTVAPANRPGASVQSHG